MARVSLLAGDFFFHLWLDTDITAALRGSLYTCEGVKAFMARSTTPS